MKRKWKTLAAMLLCLALLVPGLGGCSLLEQAQPSDALSADTSSQALSPDDTGDAEQTQSAPVQQIKQVRIGLLQFAEDPFLDEVRGAFMSRLEEWGYDEEQLTVDYRNAGGNEETARSMSREFVGGGADLIVAISLPAAKAAVEAVSGSETKVLFVGVENPQGELGIRDVSAPEGQVTGVAVTPSVQAALDLILEGTPHLEHLGMFVGAKDETLSAPQMEAMRIQCRERGIDLREAIVPEDGNVSEMALGLAQEVDAVFTPAFGLDQERAVQASETFSGEKMPWYVGSEQLARRGALACVAPDGTELGSKAADLAAGLAAGKTVSQTPVATVSGTHVTINQTSLSTLKVVFSDETLASAFFFEQSVALGN